MFIPKVLTQILPARPSLASTNPFHQIQTQWDHVQARPDLIPSPQVKPLSFQEYRAQIRSLSKDIVNPNEGFFHKDSIFIKTISKHSNAFLALTPILLELAYYQVGFAIAAKSSFGANPLQRGLRTFLAAGMICSGNIEETIRTSEFIFSMHSRVKGEVPRDIPGLSRQNYHAVNPDGLLWVYATLIQSNLEAYELFVEPISPAEKEEFYQESKIFAQLFGVPPEVIPETYNDFLGYFKAVLESSDMIVTPEVKETTRQLFENIPAPLRPLFKAFTAASLPEKYREEMGLPLTKNTQRQAKLFVAMIRKLLDIYPERANISILNSIRSHNMGEATLIDKINYKLIMKAQEMASRKFHSKP